MELLSDSHFWVGIGTLIFFGILLWQKVPALITSALDARAAAETLIAARLDDKRAADLVKRSLEEIPSKLN